MRVDVVSLFPDMIHALADYGIVGRAITSQLLALHTWNPRDFTTDRHRTVDDRPYGGGPGMVMMVEPLRAAIQTARQAGLAAKVILMSPQGRSFSQATAQSMAQLDQLILVAGRYEGVDERLVALEVDEECSIGDYVISGGELAAMVVIDAVTRLLPGALGDQRSAEQDSFVSGLLDCPHYTRPEHIEGLSVPPVLLSGDHEKIASWRRQQALKNTLRRRPELLKNADLDVEDEQFLRDLRTSYKGSEPE